MSIIIINNNDKKKKKKKNDKCNWVTELKESYNQGLSPFCLYKIWTSQQTNGKMHLYLQTPSPTKELRKTTCEMKIYNVQYRDKFKACPIFLLLL